MVGGGELDAEGEEQRKPTKPQKAESRRMRCSRRCAGQRTFIASATGTASAPPRKVRRTATLNGEKSATATFAATGEAPHRTTAAKAARMTMAT